MDNHFYPFWEIGLSSFFFFFSNPLISERDRPRLFCTSLISILVSALFPRLVNSFLSSYHIKELCGRVDKLTHNLPILSSWTQDHPTTVIGLIHINPQCQFRFISSMILYQLIKTCNFCIYFLLVLDIIWIQQNLSR